MKPENKTAVYRLLASPYNNTTWSLEDVEKSVLLMRDIRALAKSAGASIHFHVYKDSKIAKEQSLDLPLECSPEFLEKVKKLPSFHSVCPVTEATARANDIRVPTRPKATGTDRPGP